MPERIDEEIGARIRRAREEAGLSQQEFAERLGYSSPATISYLETGDRRITVSDLTRIADVLGLPFEHFLPPESGGAAERRFSLRAADIRNIKPVARRAVVDFLLFAEKHGQPCSPAPDDLRRKRPEYAASALLKKANISGPPVSPRDVARSVSVPVYEWAFGEEVSGIFVCAADKTCIGVNDSHPLVRQRFTIAHELGHYVYTRREVIVFDYLGRERGFSFESSETVEAETKANQFAADLLMPAPWIRDDVRTGGSDLAFLAKRYVVSEQAMWFRLLNLRLVEG